MVSAVQKSIAVILGVSCVAALGYASSVGWFSSKVNEGEVVWESTRDVADGESLHLQQVSATLQSGSGQQKQLVDHKVFLGMLNAGSQSFQVGLNEINRNWDVSYVPMVLETIKFLPGRLRAELVGVLGSKTGKNFGNDFDAWYQWIWKQKYQPHPQYSQFKASLYQRIDQRFAEYFQETDGAKIRLDEIRWGGVVRDGIPPLKNPKMLRAAEAKYLGDNDVVFGIKLNGDARCYPKRILAWHEMFKDTIGGESVCGVY